MLIRTNQILRLGVLTVFVLVFVVGGFIQYFIGIPNTVYTIAVLSFIYFLVFIHWMARLKVPINNVVVISLVLLLVIAISGIWNQTEIYKTFLYFIFALLPIGVFLLFQIIRDRQLKIRAPLEKLAKITVFVQLPIILIQKYGYDFFIQFNNSNQSIADYDFMFGTFFIRADHALGFFLIIYLINVFNKLKKGIHNKVPWFTIIYITATLLIMESNLSKVFLIVVLSFYLFLWIYNKIRFLGIFIIAICAVVIFSLAIKLPVLNAHFQNFSTNYTIQKSIAAFERTNAKRPQVLIVYATQMPLKIIGEGPYDYFDIFKGEFKKTKHFSQIIWSYNDLGLIGMTIVILMGMVISWNFGLRKEYRRILFGLIIFYLFMTNVYSDLAICLSLILVDERIG